MTLVYFIHIFYHFSIHNFSEIYNISVAAGKLKLLTPLTTPYYLILVLTFPIIYVITLKNC